KVEDVLTQHPAIDIIALIGVPNPERPGSELVKAFITIRDDYTGPQDEETLKEDITKFAKEKLSPYEVPKLIEIRKELPLTTIGKVYKKDLRVEAKKS
ncbi:MAG: AMP-dependent synthetase, partial [Candidatus Helarchaeota archaeon]|nr:AMP-dependent synthetase [Candidatus Helarchaeota archaeon]